MIEMRGQLVYITFTTDQLPLNLTSTRASRLPMSGTNQGFC